VSEPASPPTGLLVCRDLFFTAKVTGTAQALGLKVVTAPGPSVIQAQIERHHPRLILLDLADERLRDPEVLARVRALAGPEVTLLAFGPHVDTAAFEAAHAAGWDRVIARSRFTAELPEILGASLAGESD
jgi:CheY-like chemotaxis protein